MRQQSINNNPNKRQMTSYNKLKQEVARLKADLQEVVLNPTSYRATEIKAAISFQRERDEVIWGVYEPTLEIHNKGLLQRLKEANEKEEYEPLTQDAIEDVIKKHFAKQVVNDSFNAPKHTPITMFSNILKKYYEGQGMAPVVNEHPGWLPASIEEPIAKDSIFHTVETHFSLWDRLKILWYGKTTTAIKIDTAETVTVLNTKSKITI